MEHLLTCVLTWVPSTEHPGSTMPTNQKLSSSREVEEEEEQLMCDERNLNQNYMSLKPSPVQVTAWFHPCNNLNIAHCFRCRDLHLGRRITSPVSWYSTFLLLRPVFKWSPRFLLLLLLSRVYLSKLLHGYILTSELVRNTAEAWFVCTFDARSSDNIAEAKDIRRRACQSWKKAFWYSWWGLSWTSPFDIIITCAKSVQKSPHGGEPCEL